MDQGAFPEEPQGDFFPPCTAVSLDPFSLCKIWHSHRQLLGPRKFLGRQESAFADFILTCTEIFSQDVNLTKLCTE